MGACLYLSHSSSSHMLSRPSQSTLRARVHSCMGGCLSAWMHGMACMLACMCACIECVRVGACVRECGCDVCDVRDMRVCLRSFSADRSGTNESISTASTHTRRHAHTHTRTHARSSHACLHAHRLAQSCMHAPGAHTRTCTLKCALVHHHGTDGNAVLCWYWFTMAWQKPFCLRSGSTAS